jgi:hypothetical protein
MANVLLNADWSDRAFGSFNQPARWWVTDRSWDPAFCWGTGREYIVVEDNLLQLLFWDSTQIDPADGYGGLMYGGPGFDASPGDTWQISFGVERPSSPVGQGNDIFVRIGATTPAGDQWATYIKDLDQLFLDPGESDTYDVTFQIPGNWPEGQYQFAICHTGDNLLPVNSQVVPKGTATYATGFQVLLSNMSLDFIESGSSGETIFAILNPYVSWPVAYWDAGSPNSYPTPSYIQWNDPEFRAPLTNSARGVSISNVTTSPGWWDQDWDIYVHSSLYDPGVPEFYTDGWFLSPGRPRPAEWPLGCGDACVVMGIKYTHVPPRSYFRHSIVFGDDFIATAEFVTHLVHPSFVHEWAGYMGKFSRDIWFCAQVPCGGGTGPTGPVGVTGPISLDGIKFKPRSYSGASGSGETGVVALDGIKFKPGRTTEIPT